MRYLRVNLQNGPRREGVTRLGTKVNGARTLLHLLAKCCKLSRIPGFANGIANILGATNAASFMAVWEPLCAFVDTLVAADNFYNQKDRQNDDGLGEDVGGA